ncbi:MAG: hypothetical protein OES32_13710 [Acidobacteriota bacterium]|nr:hypothetical protein [Acidobacteriota bacterium]MDH3524635.1 hypothetical protein [Acidobacteriota bacterium]
MRAHDESNRSPLRGPRPLVLLGLLTLLLAAGAAEAQYTSSFRLEDCTWTINGRGNPYFPLRANYQLVLEGDEDGTAIRNEITVTRTSRVLPLAIGDMTKMVRTRVLEEREYEDGEVIEISRNYFVRCKETNDIYYFGEEVDIYEDGEIVSHDGAWQVGQGGAMPGIIMPGTFLLGARYFQEIAPGVALDRAKHVAMDLDVETEAGEFSGCVAVLDSTPFEPGAEDLKVYCPGVGLVIDADFELVEYGVGILP